MVNQQLSKGNNRLDLTGSIVGGEVKSRRTGHSISLTVPKAVKPKDGVVYTTFALPDGTLVYRPKAVNTDNPWLDGEYDHYDFEDALDDGLNYSNEQRVGKEL
ncbi:hypothetical protein [Schleiferilactobacillus shenzhenensis]|nr:hypothetical protein [Schleiferilactobacillus shenzhenensis]